MRYQSKRVQHNQCSDCVDTDGFVLNADAKTCEPFDFNEGGCDNGHPIPFPYV